MAKMDKTKLFTMSDYPATRGHLLKLFKRRSIFQIRANFFSNRVVDVWNSLPYSVVQAPFLNCFKSSLNKYWQNHPSKFHPACYVPGLNSRRTIQMRQEEAVMPDKTDVYNSKNSNKNKDFRKYSKIHLLKICNVKYSFPFSNIVL